MSESLRREHRVARVVDGPARWVVLVYGAWAPRLLGGNRRPHWFYTRLDQVARWQDADGWLLLPGDERIEELDGYVAAYGEGA